MSTACPTGRPRRPAGNGARSPRRATCRRPGWRASPFLPGKPRCTRSSMPESKARTGLVLQGGGALGAFEYGALRRLYEEPGFSPDVVSGVSIGAINAACLVGAKADPIETLG